MKQYPLGLVLSGGGARGVAHVGVLRALMERGIHPDCIAGASAGATVGALYAAGYSARAMLEFFQSTRIFRLANVSFGKPGILDPTKLIPSFRQYFPADSFEALQKKLRILATDIISGDPVVFDSGPLITPLLASSSVPLVCSPTEIDGRWCCDGGVADNFPVSLIRESCRVLLGVHVSPLRTCTIAELGTSLSVLERAMEIGMFLRAREKFSRCDLMIRPPALGGFGLFDVNHLTAIEAIGYEAAVAQMQQIERLVRPPD
jgi:NTE family protein